MKRFSSVLFFSLLVIVSSCQFFAPSESDEIENPVPVPGPGPKPGPDPEPDPGPNTSDKRGVCYNSLNEDEVRVLSNSNVKWVYNWGTHPSAKEDELFSRYGILYIPMQWGRTTAQSLAELRAYYSSHPECKYLLGFNEPNLGAGVGGSGITPSAAAADWEKLEQLAEEFDLELVGPALQYSGERLSDGVVYDTPKKWMDAFINAYKNTHGCRSPRYDYFCLHCYMNWPQAQSGYIKEYVKEYGKKVWLTEFCAWEYNNGGQNESAAAQKSSMIQKVDFLDSYAGADKYAWFMSSQHTSDIPFNSLFTKVGSDGSLTIVGEEYLYRGMDSSVLLAKNLEQAQVLLETSVAGSEPGMYPSDKYSALENAVSQAEAVKDSGNKTAVDNALKNLTSAVKAFEESRVPYFTKSTGELTAEDFAGSLTKNLSASAFTVSSAQGANTAAAAFDGNLDTRWESAHEDNQWLKIDFGEKVEFNCICIKWEAAFSTSFIMEVSDDGESWTTAFEEKDCTGNSETYNLTVTQNARYLRFYGKTRSTNYGHSFYEMGVSKK